MHLSPENVRQVLNLVRLDKMSALGEYATDIPLLAQSIRIYQSDHALEASPHANGQIVKTFCREALELLAPANESEDIRAVRRYKLLKTYYIEHKSRSQALDSFGLYGGTTFDRLRKEALPIFTEALNKICAEMTARAASKTSPRATTVQSLPQEWFDLSPQHQNVLFNHRSYRVLWGREREVKEIVELLTLSGDARIVSISGLGGTGKTSVAHCVAEKIHSAGHFEHVLWASAQQNILIGMHIQSLERAQLDFGGLVDMYCPK